MLSYNHVMTSSVDQSSQIYYFTRVVSSLKNNYSTRVESSLKDDYSTQ